MPLVPTEEMLLALGDHEDVYSHMLSVAPEPPGAPTPHPDITAALQYIVDHKWLLEHTRGDYKKWLAHFIEIAEQGLEKYGPRDVSGV